jgi:hypothetical protein
LSVTISFVEGRFPAEIDLFYAAKTEPVAAVPLRFEDFYQGGINKTIVPLSCTRVTRSYDQNWRGSIHLFFGNTELTKIFF